MRRPVVFLTLLALALPVAASARTAAPGDGSLSVSDLNGVPKGISVSIRARGGLIGRCDQCTFKLEDLAPDDSGIPVVTGADRARDVDGDGADDFFSGRDIRWKIIGGGYLLRIRQARDVDLSVVGKGRVLLRGVAGEYSVNGAAPVAVPPDFATFTLSASTQIG